MTITQEQYQLIADTFPKPRGTVKVSNRQALNGILYVLEHGCKWRALPERFGNWHTIYVRMSRWAASGVLDRVFQRLQQEQLIDLEVLGACRLSGSVGWLCEPYRVSRRVFYLSPASWTRFC